MSEYELLDLAKQAENAVTALLQWWGGVSFGVVALAHFASKKLNTPLVVLVVTLYISFSAMSFTRIQANLSEYSGFLRDLAVLQENGVSLSPSTVERMQSIGPVPWYNTLTFGVVLIGTFLGSICYLVYANYRERISRAQR